MATGAAQKISASDRTPVEVREALQKSSERWLRNTEVKDILLNYNSYGFPVSVEPPVQPPGGTIFLFDRKQVRFFRKDGHNWRKKQDGKTVRETHEKLKVDNQDVLNCYYAHAEEQEDNFQLQRRCYWLLEGESNLVLVHYLNVPAEALRNRSERGEACSEFGDEEDEESNKKPMRISDMASALPPYDDAADAAAWHGQGSFGGGFQMAPPGGEAFPDPFDGADGGTRWSHRQMERSQMGNLKRMGGWQGNAQPAEANRMVQPPQGSPYGNGMMMGQADLQGAPEWQQMQQYQQQLQGGFGFPMHPMQQINSGAGGVGPQGMVQGYMAMPSGYGPDAMGGGAQGAGLASANGAASQGVRGWAPPGVSLHDMGMHGVPRGGAGFDFWPMQPAAEQASGVQMARQQQQQQQQQGQVLSSASGTAPLNQAPFFPQPGAAGHGEHSGGDYGVRRGAKPEPQRAAMDRLQSQADDCSACRVLFQISDYSPNWDYTTGGCKILITGSMEGIHEDAKLFVMFGDVEVPAVKLQTGVLRCQTPSHAPGIVNISITLGDRRPCSGAVEFQYHLPIKDPPSNLINSITTETSNRDLQVRLVSRLLKETGGSLMGDDGESAADVGKGEHSNLVDAAMARVSNLDPASAERVLLLLLERELKIFTQQVLQQQGDGGAKTRDAINEVDDAGMGLIHIVSALGYEWAVELLLASGAKETLRDPWGLTPLHWAAAKGHEDTIALLLRYGAQCNSVSYPLGAIGGFTPADLASMNNHNGIAAYLSEINLAQRLSRLQLSDERSVAMRKRNRNTAVDVSQLNDASAEQEVQIITAAAREAADKISCAREGADSRQAESSTAGDAGLSRQCEAEGHGYPSPDLDLAVNRVQAILHNQGARQQYMRMREAAERNQVSVVASSGNADNAPQR
uniref:Cg-1-domain-containing protein n=1 Tax=Tetraselmis sp. GSL018 TaxID=582737 RepID=A0A061R9Y9_9CHLO|mmetsp:Transcript_31856/g.75646  ORF Transcript_31856/g.75646 Transcript_31856/m.75646 type:complete len:912 (-) Transcript_31856:158-2893(-)|eukprot:CAMPEP_0177591262 /NCGR_PEP_ID=MMETSP0419_2-20121207/7898_1 /TAXON_ID=582737 /ORGANISM="Tetraselmis sp., Strain GSL018" /LENGTH=911 /DNA_ID=CAMNT_0019081981 /DNA_START=92 /DNA_END=2827 /DNA_ORIENTATION=+